MKRIFLIFFILLTTFRGYSQFTAKMENSISGTAAIYTVYSDKNQYRYEFTEDGQKMIVIVEPESNVTLILLPTKKFYIKEPCDGMMSRQKDPVQAYAMMKKHFTEKDAGKENMAGYVCDKKELYSDNDKIMTVWYAEALKFPVKMVNHINKGTYMNLTAIEKWTPDPNMFSLPEDYTRVDERMRPVIPEPPAPEKWTAKTVQLPFQGAVSRGAVLIFTVAKEAHYKMLAENKTDKPAKIIRYSFREGKELPEKIQGPENYRTMRLYPGEKVPQTFIWEAGNEVHIKVFEGTMHLDIHTE